ncbi:MAG: LamG-like jellyroll fold domain-containing protein, partial [Bacteroidota bacterium]
LSIDETTNPDGAIILIDELTAERQYLVEANSTLQKTLTIEKGASGVLDYDSIGLILHSVCQFDPEISQVEIADTVYVSAHFLPQCSDVAVGNFNENWIINYDDGKEINVSLDDYNINLSTLEKIDFQYKTLSGTAISAMTFYKDASTDGYAEHDGPKDVINGAAEVSFIWDISSLNDGTYQIRARAHCSDGSVFESDYLTGTIDTSTPVAFGTPSPEDGVLEAGDDIMIRFSEEIEAGFVKDFNIELRSVLNGADVSHATSVQFDGVDDDVTIDNITFNNKSFTLEYWLKNDIENTVTETQVLTYSNGNNLVEISQLGTDIHFKLGANTLVADPTGYYTVVTPWDSWHHWAFIYDAVEEEVKIYMDDQVVLIEDEITYNPSFQGLLSLGNSQLAGKMHELRIWEDVRSYGEVISNMSLTLTGNEPGLYGYWMMDEGTGDQSLDHTSGRHATVNAGWSLDPGGYSWEFDGSRYLTINSTNIIADQETDFSIEFWFKGNATGSTQTLVSNGLGDGTDDTTDPNSVIVIEAQSDGTIHVLSNGYDFQGTNDDFMDSDWHHLALVVDRSANARMYIDGQQQNQTDADNLSQFYGAELTIGARIYQADPATANYDNYFHGAVDELRFWNTARPAELIEEYMHTKIERDEPGLISYHPFETYEVLLGAYIMESTLVDQVDNDDLGDVTDGYSSDGMDHFSDQKPAVRDVRGMQDIPFDFAVNDDEIVIIPTVDADRIEGQVMEITILSVQDLNGNKLLSPVTWTAYVQQNQIKWDASDISTTKPVEEDLTIIASFTNNSGAAYSYTLENIPAWLTPDHTSGVVNPQETITVELEVSEALNIGAYNHSITLSTDMGFDDQLTIDLRIFGDEPFWSVDDSEFEYSMSVFGRLIVDGEISTDEYDMVAAFVDDEIRGVVSPTYVAGVDEYQVFLNIYSNAVSSEDIDLKIYDASTGRIHENVTPDMTFVANDIQGTILNPVEIEADDRISMEIELREGWTWVSYNLDDANLSSVDATLAGIGTEGDLVKNQSTFDEYSGGLWFGTLTAAGGFTQGDMYKVKLEEAATLKIIGSPTDVYTTSIDIGQNWNYLGFIPQEQMTLEEALVSMNPSDGDVIKTANRFAMYAGSSLGWVGSLKSMAPGEGYMLYANNTSTLTYPERASLSSSRWLDERTYEDLFAVAQNEEGHTMSIIANVEGRELLDNLNDQLLVAYVNDEVRGYVPVSEVGQSDLYFLSVAAEEDDQISFKLYDALNASYLELSGSVAYGADRIAGTLEAPVALGISGALGVSTLGDIQAYPNPFDHYLDLRSPMIEASANVTLFDLSGKVIFTREVMSEGRPYLQLRFTEEVSRLGSGVYLLKVTQGQDQKIIKLIK